MGPRLNLLKGQCQKNLSIFFLLKRFVLGHIWTGKISFMNLFVQRYSQKTCIQVVVDYADTGVSVVIDYADTMSAYSRSSRWHGVSVVVDYADKCFSQISSRKRKSSRNCFSLFIWGPGRIFKANKNGQKSRDNVPLSPPLPGLGSRDHTIGPSQATPALPILYSRCCVIPTSDKVDQSFLWVASGEIL